jgi:hypothetical protein
MRAWPIPIVAGIALLLSSGCEPCSGVANCGTMQAVHVEGRIVDQGTGESVPDAQVSISLQSGASATGRTDAEGLFEETIAVDSTGVFTYDLSVVPPGDSAFVIPGLKCPVGSPASGACLLGRVVSRPYFWDFVRLAYRDAGGEVVPNAALTFRRTGGAPIYGKDIRNDSITTSTEAGGYAVLFGLSLFTTRAVPLVGDLTVKLPQPFDSSIVRDLVVRPRFGYLEAIPPYEILVGPALRSTLFFYRGAVTAPAAGVKVTFARTGGIAIGTNGLTGTTDNSGKVVLFPRPLARGQVVGDLLIEPPSAPSFTITGVALSTHDDDAAPMVLSRDLNAAVPGLRRTPR